MSFKRFPSNHYNLKESSYSSPKDSPQIGEYETPGQAPGGKGRMMIFTFIAILLSFGGYTIWDSFFRYEAHGIIHANTVGVYSPTIGIVESLGVVNGDKVEKGQIVARVINTDDQRSLAKIQDEIKQAQADILAKQSEVSWLRSRNEEIYNKALSERFAVEGELGEYEAKIKAAFLDVARVKRLRNLNAASTRELEDAIAEHEGYIARIAATKRALLAQIERVEKSKTAVEETGEDQIKPLHQRLAFLENERDRLSQKIQEGFIKSPVDGTVSNINRFAGERVNQESIFEIVEADTAQIVLYYETDEAIPQLGDTIDVWFPTIQEPVASRVTGQAKDTVAPPNQIQTQYSKDDTLVRVFLEPVKYDVNDLIIGTVVMKSAGMNLNAMIKPFLSEQALADIFEEDQ